MVCPQSVRKRGEEGLIQCRSFTDKGEDVNFLRSSFMDGSLPFTGTLLVIPFFEIDGVSAVCSEKRGGGVDPV